VQRPVPGRGRAEHDEHRDGPSGAPEERGVERNGRRFPSGPRSNETIVSAKFQVGNGGNFPFTSLLDKNIPVRLSRSQPELLHALVVAPDSPLKSIKGPEGQQSAGTSASSPAPRPSSTSRWRCR